MNFDYNRTHSDENILDLWVRISELTPSYKKSNELFLKTFTELSESLSTLADNPDRLKCYKQLHDEIHLLSAKETGDALKHLSKIERVAYEFLLLSRNEGGFGFLTLDYLVPVLKKHPELSPEAIEKLKTYPCIAKMTAYLFHKHFQLAKGNFATSWRFFEPTASSLRKIRTPEAQKLHTLISTEKDNKKLYNNLAKMFIKYPQGMQIALHIAIDEGRIDLVKWLDTIGILPEFEDLQYAAGNGTLDIVKYLLEKIGMSPHGYADNVCPNSLLSLSILGKRPEIASFLAENDPSLTRENCFYYLILTICGGDFDLLKSFSDLFSKKFYIYNPHNTSLEISLLAYNIFFNYYTCDTLNIINLAKEALKTHEKNIMRLLSELQNRQHVQTLLHAFSELHDHYMEKGEYETASQLDHFHYSTLSLSQTSIQKECRRLIQSNRVEETLELIKWFPICLDVPHLVAAEFGTVSDLKFWIEKQFPAPRNNLKYDSPALIAAINGGKLKNLRYLVEDCKVNVNPESVDKPLLRASILGHIQIARYLIEMKSKINEMILLSWIQHGSLEMVKLLIEHGVPITNHFQIGNAPKISEAARFSLQHGHLEILKLLLENGALICLEHSMDFDSVFKNFALFKYLHEELKAPLPKDLVRKCILGGSIEVLKYLEEKHNTMIKESLLAELKFRNLNHKIFNFLAESGNMLLLSYFFEELKCYPSLKDLHSNTELLSDIHFFSKAFLFSLTDENLDHRNTFRLIAYKDYDSIDATFLKEIYEKSIKNGFVMKIKSIMRNKVSKLYLLKIFKNIFPPEVSYHIGSYADLKYPFTRHFIKI